MPRGATRSSRATAAQTVVCQGRFYKLMHTEPTKRNVENPVRERRAIAWSVVGVVLGLSLLYVATRKVDLQTLIATLRAIAPEWAVAVLACTLSFSAVKTWRWSLLLRFAGDIGFSRLHGAVYAGTALNFLLSHAGEFFRAVSISKDGKVSASAAFATIVVERALDFVALLLLLVLLSAFAPDVPALVETAAWFAAVFVVAAVLALRLLLDTPPWLVRVSTTVAKPVPERLKTWFLTQVGLSRAGIVAIRDMRMMAVALLISVLQWSLIVAAVWCSARSLGESVSLTSAVATFVLLVLGLTLPTAPMQVGTTQLAFAVGLATAGIGATTALAASLVYTTFLIIPTMLIGGVCLLQGRETAGAQPC